MKAFASLVQSYRSRLQAATAAAPPSEQQLCSLLMTELASLEHGLSGNDFALIQSSLATQEQLFGRSFLSGHAGEEAEQAFNEVFRAFWRGT